MKLDVVCKHGLPQVAFILRMASTGGKPTGRSRFSNLRRQKGVSVCHWFQQKAVLRSLLLWLACLSHRPTSELISVARHVMLSSACRNHWLQREAQHSCVTGSWVSGRKSFPRGRSFPLNIGKWMLSMDKPQCPLYLSCQRNKLQSYHITWSLGVLCQTDFPKWINLWWVKEALASLAHG